MVCGRPGGRLLLPLLFAALAACSPEGRTPEEQTRDIFEAAAVGDLEIVEELLEKNPALVKGSEIVFTLKTPLHVASSPEIARVLLDAGAPLDAPDVMGLTPLHTAKRPEIVDLLIERGAKVDSPGAVGASALHMAVFPDVAGALIRRGAGVNALSKDRGTPLYSQTLDNRFAVIRLLLEKGADANFPEPASGKTPLHAAAEAGYTDVAELLVKAGAKLEARTKDGQTPLMSAVKSGQYYCAKLLVKLGAKKAPARGLSKKPEIELLLK